MDACLGLLLQLSVAYSQYKNTVKWEKQIIIIIVVVLGGYFPSC